MKQTAETGHHHHSHAATAQQGEIQQQGDEQMTRKLDKEEINNLPLDFFDGPLRLVHEHKEMLAAVKELKKEKLLGFDTEKRPSFTRGESHPPALLQLAGEHVVYIFRLRDLGLPFELTDILSDSSIVKAGVANSRDVIELRTMREFLPRGFVDLGTVAMRSGLQHHGLRGLAAVMLGSRISKGARLTNWARSDLPESALRYAATDAWIGRRIYLAMKDRGYLDTSVRFRPN